MKHLVLLFLVLASVPALWYFTDKPTRIAVWQRARPVLYRVLLAAIAVYVLLMVFYAVGSPKLL
jgi:hypothetical protein